MLRWGGVEFIVDEPEEAGFGEDRLSAPKRSRRKLRFGEMRQLRLTKPQIWREHWAGPPKKSPKKITFLHCLTTAAPQKYTVAAAACREAAHLIVSSNHSDHGRYRSRVRPTPLLLQMKADESTSARV